MAKHKIITFAPIIALVTLKAVSLRLNGMMWKIQKAMQHDAISAARVPSPAFIPVTRRKCSQGKISSPLSEIQVGKTEISGNQPARPLIWTHRKFKKGIRDKAKRSRKSGQPGQPGSREEALDIVEQSDDRKITMHSRKAGIGPMSSSLKNKQTNNKLLEAQNLKYW